MSWSEAWERGEIPWDEGAAPPELRRLADGGGLPSGRALVPGCGSGYDVLVLADDDRRVIGLDLAAGAAERFEILRTEHGIPSEQVEFVVGDFFDYDPREPFDFVWDYTFLCALEPERRSAWAECMARLIRPGGLLATLLFPVVRPGTPPVDAVGEGPPYRLTPDLALQLLSGRFDQIELRPARESHPGREGKEWLGLWRRVAE